MSDKYKNIADALAGGEGPAPDLIYGRGQYWSTSGKETEGQYLGAVAKHAVYLHYPVIDETAVFEHAHEQYVAQHGSSPDAVLPIPDKEGYVLKFWGRERWPEFIEKYGTCPSDTTYHRLFDTADARAQFEKELRTFCTSLEGSPTIVTSHVEGPRAKYQTVVYATVCFRGQSYVLRRNYGYGYPPHVCFFGWEENNQSCDHNRAAMFEEQYPGILTEQDEALTHGCDIRMFPLTDFRIAFEA